MRVAPRSAGLTAALVAAMVALSAGPAQAAAPPALLEVAPQPVPVGVDVTITGTSLSAVSSVTFTGGTADAAYTVVDDSTLRATVPVGAVDGAVTVTSPDGSASLPFDVDEPPAAVANLVARPGDSAVALSWSVPAGATGVVVRRVTGTAPPAAPTDGAEVAAGAVTSVVDAGLVNGTSYTYGVWSRDSAGSYGPVATVTAVPAVPPPAAVRLGLSAATVTHGSVVTVTGVVTTSSGLPLVGATVVLLTRAAGTGAFSGVTAAVSDSAGAVRIPYRVLRHTDFLLRRPGDAFAAEALSTTATIRARHGLSTRLSAGVVGLGGTAVVDGRVGPRTPGLTVRLERLVSSAWRGVATASLDATGAYRFPVRPTQVGEQVLRVVTYPTATHLAAAGPQVRLVTLNRVLREGTSGADVLAVERRLADLRYDVGPISGYYDYDTRLAVMAFQKVHGLARTGVVDAATRSRLSAPSTPRLRHPVIGLSVEIDLTKQVLYFARSGSIQRILPVSSGNNALYTVDGVTSRAVTPVGSYRVTRKIDGVRVSRLGELFQPAYFVGGYAIHGSPSVPGYPASHGCVRVTKAAMNRLFPLLPVGTPVRLYY